MIEYKLKALIKRPDEQYGHMTNISTSLENLQKLVGGYIELVRVNENLVIICDEEGKLKGLPINIFIGYDDAIMGDLIVIGTDGGEFADIPISMKEWKEMLREWGNQN